MENGVHGQMNPKEVEEEKGHYALAAGSFALFKDKTNQNGFPGCLPGLVDIRFWKR